MPKCTLNAIVRPGVMLKLTAEEADLVQNLLLLLKWPHDADEKLNDIYNTMYETRGDLEEGA